MVALHGRIRVVLGDDGSGKPDIALLDEVMTAFGGAAVARVLASELRDLRVVVLTG